ncbi:MAG: hypothetical protein AAEJ04_03225 [Planctomycetota bacterium]
MGNSLLWICPGKYDQIINIWMLTVIFPGASDMPLDLEHGMGTIEAQGDVL